MLRWPSWSRTKTASSSESSSMAVAAPWRNRWGQAGVRTSSRTPSRRSGFSRYTDAGCGRGGGNDRVSVLAGDRPETIVAAEAAFDGVAHQLVQQLRVRAQVDGLLFVLTPLFDGQDDIALSQPRRRQLEHLAQAGAGLGQRTDQELIAASGGRGRDVCHLLAREEQTAA